MLIKKPETIILDVESRGYYDIFDSSVVINCLKPIESVILAKDNTEISLKNSMAFEHNPHNDNFQYRMEREAVEGLFKRYCK